MVANDNLVAMQPDHETPWGRLGVAVSGDATSAAAMQRAGLDWSVKTVPVQTGCEEHLTVSGYRAVVRTSDNMPLSIVGERYTPIQNADAFSFFDKVVDAGQATYQSAGTLRGGRKVFLVAKLPGVIRVRGMDVTEKYLLLLTSHDGSTALRAVFTPVRLACSNMLNLALAAGEGVAVRHTASAAQRLQQAQRVMAVANQYYATFADQSLRMSESRFTDRQMIALAEKLVPAGDDAPSTRTRNQRDKIVELFSEGRGHETIRGTAWAALNAVAEWTDHHRSARAGRNSGRADARMASVLHGTGAALKRQAHQEIMLALAA